MLYKARIATTHKLENGYQHTRANLEDLAAGMRSQIQTDPFLNWNHLESGQPVGTLRNAYIEPFPGEPGEFALYVDFEPHPGQDPLDLKARLEKGGFSVAFFGSGIIGSRTPTPAFTLIVGLSPHIVQDAEGLAAELNELLTVASEAEVQVRSFHEHALFSTATIAFVLGWTGGKIVDKVFDKLWDALESKAARGWRKLAHRIKLTFNTPGGTLHASLPETEDPVLLRRTLDAIQVEVLKVADGTPRRRVAITVTEKWALSVHEEVLPPSERPAE